MNILQLITQVKETIPEHRAKYKNHMADLEKMVTLYQKTNHIKAQNEDMEKKFLLILIGLNDMFIPKNYYQNIPWVIKIGELLLEYGISNQI